MDCRKKIRQAISDLDFQTLVRIYKDSQKTMDSENLAYFTFLFFYPIRHFIQKLNLAERQRILTDLQRDKKMKHWMWWGLPQPYGAWGSHKVSEETVRYSLRENEGALFLLHPEIRHYYLNALELLLHKKVSFYEYFGPIDFLKWQSHLDHFKSVAQSLDDKTVLIKLDKLSHHHF